MKPKVLNDEGIFIDCMCTGIKYLSKGIVLPSQFGSSWRQQEYITDLNNFIQKWWEVDYELDKEYRVDD